MTGLPLWAQLLNLGITVGLAVIKILEFLRRGTLEVRLTRDSFFRLTESGEALFVHAVLLAREGPVLIDEVAMTLRRLSKGGTKTAEKSFPLAIIDHGEKIKGPAIRAEHHFYGASPLLYVATASTQRPVYMCVHSEYRDKQQEALVNFNQEMFKLKREIEEAIAAERPKSDSELVKDIEARVRPHYATMCGLIQLEDGDYELVLTIRYEKVGFLVWKRQRSINSYGYFSVDDGGLKSYKEQLLNVLYTRAHNFLKGTNVNIPYPEYTPKNFAEAKDRNKAAVSVR